MKGRESGMPQEDYRQGFFDAACVIQKMFGQGGCKGDVFEFGSVYGTFTIPAAAHCTGTVSTFELEPALIEQLQSKVHELSIQNIHAEVRDFVAAGTGLEPQSQLHSIQCKAWLQETGYCHIQDVDLQACCPYHFGISALR